MRLARRIELPFFLVAAAGAMLTRAALAEPVKIPDPNLEKVLIETLKHRDIKPGGLTTEPVSYTHLTLPTSG